MNTKLINLNSDAAMILHFAFLVAGATNDLTFQRIKAIVNYARLMALEFHDIAK